MDTTDLRFGTAVPYLRAWREYRLLSQGELAQRGRVHRDTIVAAEHGRPIRLTTLGRLAKVLDVDRRDLVYQQPPTEVSATP